jgi:hypothetical protein
LRIHSRDGSFDGDVEGTVRGLGDVELSGSCGNGSVEEGIREGRAAARVLKVGSLVGKAHDWGRQFEIYEYVVRPESEIGRLLGRVGPGAEWKIRLARPELGIKRYAFGVEDEDVIGEDGEPRPLTREEKAALPPLSHRHGTSVGKCTFKTVKSLSWPPRSET